MKGWFRKARRTEHRWENGGDSRGNGTLSRRRERSIALFRFRGGTLSPLFLDRPKRMRRREGEKSAGPGPVVG
eukprot:scaffold94_cov273-Pavlova_lutheri.AAC.1